MFTLVYNNGQLNRPDTLQSFLQSNIGKSSLLQVDCVTPYKGTEEDLIKKVCEHLSTIDPEIEVKYGRTQNASSEKSIVNSLVHFMVLQIQVCQR